ncbi:MAG: hypothetical protein IJT01_01560 [Selenomonadaceae bacterium]|nr:hypothetical protein [Selenomonadaceae bacterium]
MNPHPPTQNRIGHPSPGPKPAPRRWHGQSCTVYLKEDRGTLAFEGEFSFDTSHLAQEEQQLLLLLAQFSAFSGIGRLTGHGLGQTRARYLG